MLSHQIDILVLLAESTARGLTLWSQSETDPDHFFTTSGPVSTHIQFKWVAFNGETGSDRDFVEIGVAGHHMSGTPGWWMAVDILAKGKVGHWPDHQEMIRDSYQKTIRVLESALAKR